MEEPVQPPKITALILSYNTAGALRGCLTALEASQGRELLEIIVVDNGSVDGSGQMDVDFPAVTFMRLPRNFGSTKALNIAMRTAAAEYVLFLAPWVMVQAGTVAALVARLDADGSAAAVCPMLVDEAGIPRSSIPKLPGPEQFGTLWKDPEQLPVDRVDETAVEVNVGYPGWEALAIRKQFVKAINWLDERYGDFGGDLELAYQIQRSGRKLLMLPAVRAAAIPRPKLGFDDAALATIAADRVNGVVVFASKHLGWAAGLKVRMAAILDSLVRFRLRLLMDVASGTKIDGSQGTL